MGAVRVLTSFVALLVLMPAGLPQAQDAAPQPLTLVSQEGRRALPTVLAGGRELVALTEVARLFGVTVQDDAVAGAVTVSYRGRTIVGTADRQMASVEGRVVSLPSPIVRVGGRWLVPIEFLSGPLASIYGQRIEFRRASRLLLVGDVLLPRVTARIEAAGPPTRATVDIAPAAMVTLTRAPGQLLLHIEADGLDATLPRAGGGLIDAIRAGEEPTVIVVAVSPDAGVGRATITTEGNATRVLIDVPAAEAAPASSRAPAPAPPGPAPTTASAPPPEPAAPPAELLSGVSRRWQTIVIDPGHGGHDTGVRGAAGLEEKTVTLDVARLVRTLVETRLGLRVILTRDTDLSLSLDQRAAMANNSRANLLLSLHVNGTRATGQTGAEIFHLRLDQESQEALRAASAGAVSLVALGGRRRVIELVPWDLAQARYIDSSALLARVLREELQRQVPMSARPIRQVPMRLLSSANMPAALIEMAYLTSPAQEARLDTDEFKAATAQGIFNAIVRFRAWSEDQPTP
jgi:N-acetylmuramoyl-L-alanine amidase